MAHLFIEAEPGVGDAARRLAEQRGAVEEVIHRPAELFPDQRRVIIRHVLERVALRHPRLAEHTVERIGAFQEPVHKQHPELRFILERQPRKDDQRARPLARPVVGQPTAEISGFGRRKAADLQKAPP